MVNDRSGAAQVATAHCPNERTLDHAVCNYSDESSSPSCSFNRSCQMQPYMS